MYSKFILHNFARIQKVSNGHGGDGQNRTDPIFPYEGNAQTFYATSPKILVREEGFEPTLYWF